MFSVTSEEIGNIKSALASTPSIERIYHVELSDSKHIVCASVEKTVYR